MFVLYCRRAAGRLNSGVSLAQHSFALSASGGVVGVSSTSLLASSERLVFRRFNSVAHDRVVCACGARQRRAAPSSRALVVGAKAKAQARQLWAASPAIVGLKAKRRLAHRSSVASAGSYGQSVLGQVTASLRARLRYRLVELLCLRQPQDSLQSVSLRRLCKAN